MGRTVSVVIPTFNYGRFISDAIRSVLDQSCPAAEIIVVDDGSTDDTPEVVNRFGNAVKYIRQDNAGVCAARNAGVRESKGDLIAFLDADDYWEPTNIEEHISKFDENGEIGLVHCGLREFDGETGETIRLLLDGGEEGVAENLLLWKEPTIIGPGGAIMLSREVFDRVGGFDTRMKVGEDWDFCYRVAREYKVAFVAKPLVNYRSHSKAAHRNVEEMERGMSLFYEKAFATEDGSVLRLKRRAYGNFHKVLAGSYFHTQDYTKSVKHTIKSIWMRPANLPYFLKTPLRRIKKTS